MSNGRCTTGVWRSYHATSSAGAHPPVRRRGSTAPVRPAHRTQRAVLRAAWRQRRALPTTGKAGETEASEARDQQSAVASESGEGLSILSRRPSSTRLSPSLSRSLFRSVRLRHTNCGCGNSGGHGRREARAGTQAGSVTTSDGLSRLETLHSRSGPSKFQTSTREQHPMSLYEIKPVCALHIRCLQASCQRLGSCLERNLWLVCHSPLVQVSSRCQVCVLRSLRRVLLLPCLLSFHRRCCASVSKRRGAARAASARSIPSLWSRVACCSLSVRVVCLVGRVSVCCVSRRRRLLLPPRADPLQRRICSPRCPASPLLSAPHLTPPLSSAWPHGSRVKCSEHPQRGRRMKTRRRRRRCQTRRSAQREPRCCSRLPDPPPTAPPLPGLSPLMPSAAAARCAAPL